MKYEQATVAGFRYEWSREWAQCLKLNPRRQVKGRPVFVASELGLWRTRNDEVFCKAYKACPRPAKVVLDYLLQEEDWEVSHLCL